MTNKELQTLLSKYPDAIPVRLLPKNNPDDTVIDFTEENILKTTDRAWVNQNAPEDDWDTEDGKIVYDGNPFILINPIIV
jgi:hypothetical protein